MSQTKKWGEEDFWGLGFEWDPQWVLTDQQKELQRKLIEVSRTTLRDNALESDKKLLFPRKNFEALAKLGLLGHGSGDYCPIRLRQHGHVLHHASRRRRGGLFSLPQQRDAEERPSPPRQGCVYRHPLLLRSGDGLALLVSGLIRRRESRRRLEGPQEGVLDHIGRLRRLVHHPDDQPGFRRQLCRPLLLADHEQRGQGGALQVGRPGPARQSVGYLGSRQCGRAIRPPGRPEGRRRQFQRRMRRSLLPALLLLLLEWNLAGRA